MRLNAVGEGIGIALDALRSNKIRAGLTILGIVIGVATVVGMASLLSGVRASVLQNIESVGRTSFMVTRFDFTQARLTGPGQDWQRNPPVAVEEARMLSRLPELRTVTPDVDFSGAMRVGDRSVSSVDASGSGPDWPDYVLGDFVAGRSFLPDEVERSVPVVVISEHLAEALFEDADPIGAELRFRGARFTVVGVYRMRPNVFSGLVRNWAVVPYTAAFKHLGVSDNFLSLLVVPHEGVSQDVAMDAATAALRITRGLRPGQENDFALVRQEAFAEMFDRFTGVFFLVILVLSSIGLMVGGVGVVAIMMISVTERTREIGVRKAVGATRREILWQFLVEAATVTVVGAAIGMALGLGGSLLLAAATPIPAAVPLWAVAAALGVAAFSGVGFGLYPAWKAARLDPVEALRYE